ncbi:thiolase family protein [Gaopeijia maritima]|uniref:Thiolase family protein n=1 Tax=Gaopeijia maritima TaxID=3119007 RepID=A0ABU9E4B5_9BACT
MSPPALFPRARIPYGTWGSSYFPAWQTSALAQVNIGQFAGESMGRVLGLRGVPQRELEYLVLGSTVPWHWKFWTAPMVASIMGHRIPGFHVEQACATGLQAVLMGAATVEAQSHDTVGVLTFDRTSDSPVGVFPERRAYERTQAIADVWDNFGFDPATGKAMIAAAGMTARKYRIERGETDEISFLRHQQYFDTKERGFFNKTMVPFDVLTVQGRPLGTVDDDVGVKPVSLGQLRAQRELDTCVTSGTQTHASDGMACLLVTTEERAKELSPRPEISIRLVGKAEARAQPSLMPEAPGIAVNRLMDRLGMKLDDIAVFKNHNPFAVNDAVFQRQTGVEWTDLNRTGCSLVWGHPQGPTLTRSLIEGLEEAVELGGGHVLLFGCAAGDVGIAALFEVS